MTTGEGGGGIGRRLVAGSKRSVVTVGGAIVDEAVIPAGCERCLDGGLDGGTWVRICRLSAKVDGGEGT